MATTTVFLYWFGSNIFHSQKWDNFFKTLFCIGVSPINNVVIVSAGQQRDSPIHIHVSILLQIPLPSRLPHDIERVPWCPCWLPILNIAVGTGKDPLERMDWQTNSSILAWRIPLIEEPGVLYSPWGCKEWDMTKWLTHTGNGKFFL